MERFQLLVDEHRRLLAAILAGLAVLAGLSAVRQAPSTDTIVVARHDLGSGHLVTVDDLRNASVPPDAVPAGVLRRDLAAIDAGSTVDVVAVAPGGETPAEVVARGVEIVTVPGDDEGDSPAVGIVTTEEGALALAQAGLSSRLTIITSSA